jgi:hypothetical protein
MMLDQSSFSRAELDCRAYEARIALERLALAFTGPEPRPRIESEGRRPRVRPCLALVGMSRETGGSPRA